MRPVLAALALAALGCTTAPESGEPISVVLISPDSLRVDRLGPWQEAGEPEVPDTPQLDRLLERGTLYTNAWATSPWTAPAMVSVMTGHDPPAHGVVYRDDTTPPSLPTLPGLLAERGYAIGNFTFFSQISYFRNLGLGPRAPELEDHRAAPAFAQWLRRLEREEPGRPFFAWVHLLETHLPYGATGYRATEVAIPGSPGLEASQLQATVPIDSTTFAPGDRPRLIELYDRDVVAMDRSLGEILDALEESGRSGRTLIVFVADHGEELLDQDWVGHASTAVEARLLPEILRVPLVVAGPGVPSAELRDELVRQTQLLPTLAPLLDLDVDGLPTSPLPGLGESWWQRLADGSRLAFFDSSPGGNLTPQERRGERLQGVTDGECLLEVRQVPGKPDDRSISALAEGASCGEARVEGLLRELDRWRARQVELRLALLAGGEEPPPSEEVDSWEVAIDLVEPEARVLSWESTGGTVALSWRGEGSRYWLEYELLGATATEALLGAVDGSFLVEQSRVVFGPVPEGFWRDVASYAPLRLRVVDPDRRQRSPWVEFEIE